MITRVVTAYSIRTAGRIPRLAGQVMLFPGQPPISNIEQKKTNSYVKGKLG
jgi:hypothetical protein